MKTLIAAACALTLGLGAAAHAQTAPAKPKTTATSTASSTQATTSKPAASPLVTKPLPKQVKRRDHVEMLDGKPKS